MTSGSWVSSLLVAFFVAMCGPAVEGGRRLLLRNLVPSTELDLVGALATAVSSDDSWRARMLRSVRRPTGVDAPLTTCG